jgi:tetratricopeptide (TPR) repeat protein
LFDYLRLPPNEQQAQYVRNLKAGLAGKPDDLKLLLQLGKTLLMENKTEEGTEAYRKVLSLTQDPAIYAECATDLLGVEQYGLAREFLMRLVAVKPDDAGAKFDLAIAVFHSQGPEAGLESLDQMPPAQRGADFFLLRAQILDALGRFPQAADYLNRGLQAEPTRADLFLQAALFLIKHGDYERASGLLEKAVRTFPDLPELQLTQAVVFAVLRQHDTAQDILSKIEARWPEWNMPYVIHGIILTIRRRPSEAEPLLETAISLGAENSVAYFYLALALTIENPPKVPKAHEAIVKALALNAQDAFILALAGRIAYLQEDHQTAREHLQAALRLWPDMVEAHQTLAGVYRAIGDKEKSIAELKEIVRIKQENPTADQTPPFPATDLLFSVRPPARSSP